MGTRLNACFLPSETNILQECRGERESGKQGPLRGGGKSPEPTACGNEGRGVRKPME